MPAVLTISCLTKPPIMYTIRYFIIVFILICYGFVSSCARHVCILHIVRSYIGSIISRCIRPSVSDYQFFIKIIVSFCILLQFIVIVPILDSCFVQAIIISLRIYIRYLQNTFVVSRFKTLCIRSLRDIYHIGHQGMTLVHTRRLVFADRESAIYRYAITHNVSLIVRIFAGSYPYLHQCIVCFALASSTGMVTTRCFFHRPLQTTDVFLGMRIVNPAVGVAGIYESIFISIRCTIIPGCCIRMIRISAPERTRTATYLSIRITGVIMPSRSPSSGCAAGSIA